MSWSIALVCEAPADRQTAAAITTRVACGAVDWMEPEYLQFRGYKPDDPQLLWREVKATAVANRVSVVGFINGLPASPDAHNAMRALLLFNRLDPKPDAVLLIRDSDDDLERHDGLHQGPRRGAVAVPRSHRAGAHQTRVLTYRRIRAEERRGTRTNRERATAPRIRPANALA